MATILVKKTKSPVSCNNLKLGTTVFHVYKKNIAYKGGIAFRTYDKSITLDVDGDGCFVRNTADFSDPSKCLTHHTIPANSNYYLYFSDGDYDVVITTKYDLETLPLNYDGMYVDLKDYSYCTSLKQFLVHDAKATGDISNLAQSSALNTINIEDCSNISGILPNLSNLRVLNISKTKISLDLQQIASLDLTQFFGNDSYVSGNISAFSNMTNLTSLWIRGTNANLSGSIESLGNLINCKSLKLNLNSAIEGELNNLISALRTNGATGTFTFNFGATGVTYNGNPCGNSDISITI